MQNLARYYRADDDGMLDSNLSLRDEREAKAIREAKGLRRTGRAVKQAPSVIEFSTDVNPACQGCSVFAVCTLSEDEECEYLA